jgi:hypothetical protein
MCACVQSAAKDAEIARLRTEIARRDGKVEGTSCRPMPVPRSHVRACVPTRSVIVPRPELQKRVSRLIDDLQRATQQNTSLSTEVARLYAFRQSILESFDDRDLTDLRTVVGYILFGRPWEPYGEGCR